MNDHHYTNSNISTAQVAVNAGTCLEDADFENNVFTYIGQAVTQVCVDVCVVFMCMSVYVGR